MFKTLTSASGMMTSSKFALFVALLNSIYKMVLCLLRRVALKIIRLRKTRGFCVKDLKKNVDKYCAPLAGFCAGLTLILDSNSTRRSMIAVTALSRLMDSGFRKVEADDSVPKLAYKEIYLFVLGNLCA
jgi:hypothetical protein